MLVDRKTQSSEDTGMLVDLIVEELGDLNKCKKLSIEEVVNLGYRLTERKIVISKRASGEPSFYIYEVVDEDTLSPVSFCYLYSVGKNTGLILKHNYDYYVRRAD